jgi:hypothetical protein
MLAGSSNAPHTAFLLRLIPHFIAVGLIHEVEQRLLRYATEELLNGQKVVHTYEASAID